MIHIPLRLVSEGLFILDLFDGILFPNPSYSYRTIEYFVLYGEMVKKFPISHFYLEKGLEIWSFSQHRYARLVSLP